MREKSSQNESQLLQISENLSNERERITFDIIEASKKFQETHVHIKETQERIIQLNIENNELGEVCDGLLDMCDEKVSVANGTHCLW